MQAREVDGLNERQRGHADYYLERLAHWKSVREQVSMCRMLAARDADEKYPLRSEEEAREVLTYLERVEAGLTS